MKYSKYFGAKRHGFIKSESNLAPKGMSHFKSENIRCDTCYFINLHIHQLAISPTVHFSNFPFVKLHFVNLPFHHFAILLNCHFVNLPFHPPDIL
jgi:hypothetical protein